MNLDKFNHLLMALQEELIAVDKTSSESTKPVELDQTRVGRLSRMDALQRQAMSVEIEQRRKIQLQKVGAALQRLQQGEYGYCLRCDELINENRLEIDPCATLCIHCASSAESSS